MKANPLYFDNAASTQIDDIVLDEYKNMLSDIYANPSSLHSLGINGEKIIINSKKIISNLLNVHADEIIFTSGGTESNNTAILGTCEKFRERGGHFITNVIEHPSVLEPFKFLESVGFEVTYLKVDKNGEFSLEELENSIRENTRLVSIMHVNNETGNINPISKIGKIIKNANSQILFHVDGVQGFGKIPINLKDCNVDFYSASGHKIHAPKGIGFLYKKKNISINPLILGGGQQNKLRAGTENPPLVHSFAKAATIAFEKLDENHKHVQSLKSYVIDELKSLNISVIGSENTSGYILNLFIDKKIKGEVLLNALSIANIYISTGSACNSTRQKKTVIAHIDNSKENNIIRISFSRLNTLNECTILVKTIFENIKIFGF